jgi:hypothetical protein
MFVSAKDKVGPFNTVKLIGEDGQVLAKAFAANTDEGWYEEYVTTETGKIATVNGGLVTRKVEGAKFKLVDRHTGEVVAESK